MAGTSIQQVWPPSWKHLTDNLASVLLSGPDRCRLDDSGTTLHTIFIYLFSSRLRRVERITNKLHSLSPHYKLWGKKGGRGVNTKEVAENRTRLFSFTSRRPELENTPIEQTQMSISCGLICFSFKREQSVIACWSSYYIILFFFLFSGCLLLTKNVDGPKLY